MKDNNEEIMDETNIEEEIIRKQKNNRSNKKKILLFVVIIIVVFIAIVLGSYHLLQKDKEDESKKEYIPNKTDLKKEDKPDSEDSELAYVITETYTFNKVDGRLLGNNVLFENNDKTKLELFSYSNNLLYRYDKEYSHIDPDFDVDNQELYVLYTNNDKIIHLDKSGKVISSNDYKKIIDKLEKEHIKRETVNDVQIISYDVPSDSYEETGWTEQRYKLVNNGKILVEGINEYLILEDKIVLLYDEDVKVFDTKKKEYSKEKVKVDDNHYLDYSSCKNGTKLFDNSGKEVINTCAKYYNKLYGKFYYGHSGNMCGPVSALCGFYTLYYDGKKIEEEVSLTKEGDYIVGHYYESATGATYNLKGEKVKDFDLVSKIDDNTYIGYKYNDTGEETFSFLDSTLKKKSKDFSYIDCSKNGWCEVIESNDSYYIYYKDQKIIDNSFTRVDIGGDVIVATSNSKTYSFKLEKGRENIITKVE